jgi:hypothetical protein
MGAICVAALFLPLLIAGGFLLKLSLRDLARGEIATLWSPIRRSHRPKTFWFLAIFNVLGLAFLLFSLLMFELMLIFGPG